MQAIAHIFVVANEDVITVSTQQKKVSDRLL